MPNPDSLTPDPQKLNLQYEDFLIGSNSFHSDQIVSSLPWVTQGGGEFGIEDPDIPA